MPEQLLDFSRTLLHGVSYGNIKVNYLVRMCKSGFLRSFNESCLTLLRSRILVLFGPSEGPLFLEVECSYSPSTDLRWINS
jgi:hypothetical protein